MKYKYAALAQKLTEALDDKYEVEAYFNEIRVVIDDDNDKDLKFEEFIGRTGRCQCRRV
ncbi:hypothetical protein [Mucilaginibacter sp.]|uniref:hypothetical protein n=1 Tax=Mucilaginibacter sp. TaxID=1882438 RepID=UPI0025FC6B96|nr:hypothetical protein [Mucilaginibacter sp.]